MIEYEVKSIAEYLNAITALKDSHEKLWFRGHASSEYTLMPTVYRSPYSWKKNLLYYINSKPEQLDF